MSGQLLDWEVKVAPKTLHTVPTVDGHSIHLHEDEIRAIQQYVLPEPEPEVLLSFAMDCEAMRLPLSTITKQLEEQGYTLQKINEKEMV